MTSLLSHPTLAAAAQTTLAVSLLILLVLLIRRPFARRFGAGAAYSLWTLPALRLVMPPLPSNLSLFGLLQKPADTAADTSGPGLYLVPTQPETLAIPPELPVAAPSPANVSIVESTEVALTPAVTSDFSLTPWLIGLWAAGAIIFMTVAIWRQARFNWLVKIESDPVDAKTARLATDIARELRLKRHVRLRSSLICAGPLVTGVLRPTVVLPAWFSTDYTETEQRQAITHELMHVKRGDLWSLPLAGMCLALQWFNPLAHLAMRAFRHDQEAACDSDVLSHTGTSPRSYGETLVKTARIARPAPHVTAAGLPLAHEIKERLILMQNPIPTLRRRLTGTAIAITAGTAAIALTATAGEPPASPESPASPSLTLAAAFGEPPARPERPPVSETTRVITIDGRRVGGNVVILSDPMEDWQIALERELEPKMRELQARMPEFPAFGTVGETIVIDLSNLRFPEASGISVENLSDGRIMLRFPESSLTLDGQLTLDLEDMAAFEATIEELTTRLEANADTLELVIETVMEDFEADIEARAATFEIAMEDWAEEFEAFMETEFETGAESAAETLETLVEGCEDSDDAVAISTVTGDNGKTYRALCLNDASLSLGDARVQSFIAARRDLTAAERQRYSSEVNELLGGR